MGCRPNCSYHVLKKAALLIVRAHVNDKKEAQGCLDDWKTLNHGYSDNLASQ